MELSFFTTEAKKLKPGDQIRVIAELCNSLGRQGAWPADAQFLRSLDEQVWSSDAVVTSVVPELCIAQVESSEGVSVALSDDTPGVTWRTLHEGQRLNVTLQGLLAPRVIKAKLAE